MRKLTMILSLLAALGCYGQQTFSEAELVQVVKTYHPLVRAADLDVQQAQAAFIAAQGAFDPTFRWNKGSKNFEATSYYDRSQAEIKIPTWYGVDIYAGREHNEGLKLNPEETKGTITYLGISMPLLQNLLTDKRRTTLQQARLLQGESLQQRQSRINDLVFEARQQYWHWWEQHKAVQVLDSSLQLARQRLHMIRQYVQLGDRPALDTVEARTQLQQLELKYLEAQTLLGKAVYALAVYLWKEGQQPYILPDNVHPATILPSPALAKEEILQQSANHPDLLVYRYKLPALKLQQRLAAQSLLPEVTIKYQHLGRDWNDLKSGPSLLQSNYRYGITVSMPLRLSEARASISKARAKLEQAKLEQTVKQVQVQNKVLQYELEWQQLSRQIGLQQEMLASYSQLQRGEEVKFQNGESSLFLVNARMQKTLETLQKLIELQAKQQKARAALYWSAGIFDGNEKPKTTN